MLTQSQQPLHTQLIDLIEENNFYFFKELMSKNTFFFTDNELLNTACALNKFDFVKYLIDNGAKVDAEENFCLRLSAEKGYLNIVKYLIKNGACINAKNGDVLSSAASEGHLHVVQYLIKKGVNTILANDYSLVWSFKNKHYSVFSYLLEHGCDFTLLSQHLKNDLLNCAAFYNKLEFVDSFLSLGADYNLLNKHPNIEIQTVLKNFFIKKHTYELENLLHKTSTSDRKKTKI